MKGLQLLATGGALPGRVVTNEDLSRQVDTSDEWITTRTGIRQRYYCTESEDAATLAIAAARQALARSGLAASDIACCVAATLSAPTATPSVACRVQAALGLPENRPAFDVNAACSGFIYAIAAAHGLLNTLGGRYALVIGCEALSRMVDPTSVSAALQPAIRPRSRWMARRSFVLRWKPCRVACKPCWSAAKRPWLTWIGSSAIRPIAALLTIVSNTCTQNRQNFIKIWTAMEIPVLPAFPLPCMKWWKMIYCTPARPWPASVLAAG